MVEAPQARSWFTYVVAAVSAVSGMLFGYDTGIISSAILFIARDFGLGPVMEEVVVSAVLMGAIVGAVVGGPLADYFGRRKTLLIAAIIFAVGGIGTALVPSTSWLIAGRIVVGLAIGIASFVAPMYISEVAPPNIRGQLVSFNQLAITLGILISYAVGFAFAATEGWRWMLGLAVVPASVLGIGLLWMPETPRWLVRRHDENAARRVLRQTRTTDDIDGELREIQETIAAEHGDWRELLGAAVRPALVVGIGLAIFQQVTGINTVIYYAPTIFQMAGFQSASTAILATVGTGTVNLVLTAVALLLLDRVGRRPLLLIGTVGMVVSLAVLGLAFALSGLGPLLGWIAIGSLMFYVGSFAIGLGPVFWLLIAEIYPLSVRGWAMGLATLVNWAANLAVALTFLSLIGQIGRSNTFWLYAGLGVLSWLFAWFLVPETKGKSLEQIEAYWRAGKHPESSEAKLPGEDG